MIRFSEETLSVLNALGDGVFIVDATGIIQSVNTAGAQILGYTEAELLGMWCLDPFGAVSEKGKRITKKNAAITRTLKSGKKTHNALRQFTNKRGDKLWASITVTPLVRKGKKRAAIIVFRDITKEHQLKEYHADFARVASHQMRTPLSNVLWLLEHLSSEMSGTLNEEQKELAQQAHKTAKQLYDLFNDLLHISDLHGKKNGTATSISLTSVINTVVENMESFANASNIDIVVHSNQDDQVHINKTHAQTAIQNIIENAIRYAYPHSTIDITLEKDPKKEKKLVLACTNQGIGIPKSSQKFVFSKFYRAKNAVKKQGNGTGLGLYLSKKLMEQYGGDITFTSVPKKQTTFSLVFRQ